MAFDRDERRLSFVPLDEKVTVAPDGIINHYRDYWWAVCPERGLIFYQTSAQCNRDEALARRVLGRLYPWAELRQIPSVFLRVNPTDYCHC